MMQRLFGAKYGFRAARAAAEQTKYGNVVRVQRVRLFKARKVMRSLLIGTAVSMSCWYLYRSTVVAPFLRHLDKLEASLTQQEREQLDKEIREQEDEEEDEPFLFIAFPFTTTQIPSRPYRMTDPEWAKYAEISRDTSLQDRMRQELVNKVTDAVDEDRRVKLRIGNKISVRRYWLDIDFPYRPPPTFEQSGLLVDNDGISWASEPVDSETVFRLRRLLWPTAMATSTWAFTSAMARQHWFEVKRAFGIDTSSPPASSAPHPPKPTLQRRNDEGPLLPPSSGGRQTPDGTPTTNDNAQRQREDQQPSSTAVDKKQRKGAEQDDTATGGRTTFLKEMASHVESSRQMSSGPWAAFQRKLLNTWRPQKNYPPRGCVMVSGFVEVETTKGYVVVDVVSHWDPTTKTYHPQSLFMNVRRMQAKYQTPLER